MGAHLGVQVGSDSEGYVDFWRANEPRMRRALVAQYGPQDGRAATGDALSWAWEHWADVTAMANPVGYLYRVGQTAARKHQQRGRVQVSAGAASAQDPADGDLDLIDALRDLSDQQRVVLLLVHAHGYSQREAADVLDIAVSTVRVHLEEQLSTGRRDGEFVFARPDGRPVHPDLFSQTWCRLLGASPRPASASTTSATPTLRSC